MKNILAAALLMIAVQLNAAVKAGDLAPGFVLTDNNGEKIAFSSILAQKKPVLLSFFATWCKPCQQEMPHLININKQNNISLYMISIDNTGKESIMKFLQENSIDLKVLFDPEGRITGENYGFVSSGVANIPKLVLVSPSGKVVYVSEGYDENLERNIAEKLELIKNEVPEKPKEVTIFFTNSTNGYLESCDCPNHPYGGLVRRVSYLKEARVKYPDNILLDSGDLFKPYTSEPLADIVLKIYELMKYDAVGIGDQEFSYSGFENAVGKYKIPFLSSNLSVCGENTCKPLTVNKLIIEKAGIKFLIISVIDPEVFVLYPENITKHLTIIPVKDILAGIIQNSKGSYDQIILVSHCGYDVDKQIAMDFPDINLIAGGHSQTLLSAPVQIGKTLIVQAGTNAQNVGKLVLKFDDKNNIKSNTYEIVPLKKDVPDDPEVRKMIDEYKKAAKIK